MTDCFQFPISKYVPPSVRETRIISKPRQVSSTGFKLFSPGDSSPFDSSQPFYSRRPKSQTGNFLDDAPRYSARGPSTREHRLGPGQRKTPLVKTAPGLKTFPPRFRATRSASDDRLRNGGRRRRTSQCVARKANAAGAPFPPRARKAARHEDEDRVCLNGNEAP